MASNSKKLGELFGGTNDIKTDVLDNVDPSFVSDKSNTSTGYFDLPNGTTAQRPTAAAGMIRFNSTFNLAEYYTGTEWKAVDTPPQITNVSPSNFDTEGTTITVTGSNFQSGITAKLQGDDGTDYNAASTTRVSSSEVTFDITAAMVTDNDPFKVLLTNTSGLSGEYESVYYAVDPAWSTSAGSLGTYYNYNRTGLSYQVTATSTDADDTITYAVTSGSLPSGLSLNTSTGAITGDGAEVGSSTTYTFEITATATGEGSTTKTAARTFTLTNAAYVITSYTSVGSGTYSVPSGISSVEVLVVAGGAGGGMANGGGGGAGGLVFAPNYPVTPGGSVSYTVGAGGGGATSRSPAPTDGAQSGGQNSVFGQLTAVGGGGGRSRGGGPISYAGRPGYDGGSGGGASSSDNPGAPQSGGSSTQPSNGGHPTGQGYGNAGGSGGVRSPHRAGGGGGAGAAGADAGSMGNPGGNGRQYDIAGQGQEYYAGGGGGHPGSNDSPWPWTADSLGGQGGGGIGASYGPGEGIPLANNPPAGNYSAIDGAANRGGGGGGIGADDNQTPRGGNGGSGIVIVKY